MTFQSWAGTCVVTVSVLLAIIYRRELMEWARECFHDEDGYDTEMAEYARAIKADEQRAIYGDVYDLAGHRQDDEDMTA